MGALREVLRLITGGRASLREAIEWREIESLGGPFSCLFGVQGSLFLVFVPPELPPEQRTLLRKIVPEWTPLGAQEEVVSLEPGFALRTPLVLGVNTVIPQRELRLGLSRLGQDSTLARRSPVSRLNLLATLGRDFQI
ncbi:hypothetical protein FVE67_00040 [Thermosulfurimonas marina]|uniref:Uncharacterized protein n=1 Tax=Thermosulfurimonas marina TaxID=2047767 RepID=A0A6H1WQ46_9BACT|nr:hypothetical protein [Thermosulfurimonas marina]QJA05279.1 hypothetical protein FVE67_00040 [Thermosulfurimonas marina]